MKKAITYYMMKFLNSYVLTDIEEGIINYVSLVTIISYISCKKNILNYKFQNFFRFYLRGGGQEIST